MIHFIQNSVELTDACMKDSLGALIVHWSHKGMS